MCLSNFYVDIYVYVVLYSIVSSYLYVFTMLIHGVINDNNDNDNIAIDFIFSA